MKLDGTAAKALTPLGQEGGLPTRERAVEVAEQFEAIFVQMLVKDMRESNEAFGEGFFVDGAGSSIQTSLFDSMLSEKIAGTGRIGFADALVRDWEAKGHLADSEGEAAEAEVIGIRKLGGDAPPFTQIETATLGKLETRDADDDANQERELQTLKRRKDTWTTTRSLNVSRP